MFKNTWSFVKFSSLKFHWLSLNQFALMEEQDTHKWIRLIPANNDGPYQLLSMKVVAVSLYFSI